MHLAAFLFYHDTPLITLPVNDNCLLTQSVEGDRRNTPDLLNVELI